MEQSFVVLIEGSACVMDAARMIDAIDMSDCAHVSAAYRVNEDTGKLEELTIRGTWSDVQDPLYIEVHDAEHNVVASGRGTDH